MFARQAFKSLRTLPQSQLRLGVQSIATRRSISDQARKAIDDAVHANPLVLFMKGNPDAPACGFSRAACQILDVQGVPRSKLKTFDVLQDQELRDSIKEYSEWPTIPQLYLGGEFVGGCDIMLSMHQSGELEKLLIEKGLVDPEVLPEDAPEPKKSA